MERHPSKILTPFSFSLFPYLFLFLILSLAILVSANSIYATTGSIKLSWEPNTEPDIAGYKIYYGTSSRNYTTTINVGNVTTYELSGLDSGVTYYIAATAYDTSALESEYSNEVTATIGNSIIIPPDDSPPPSSLDPSGRPSSFKYRGVYIWQDTDDLEWHLWTNYSPNGIKDNYRGTTIVPVSGKITQASYYSPDWSGETISWDATRIYINNMAVNGTGGRDGVNFLVTGSEVSFKIVFTGSLTPQNIFIGAKLAHPSSTSFSLKGLTAGESPSPPPPSSLDPSGRPSSFKYRGVYIWQDTDDLEWHLWTSYSPNGTKDNYRGTTIIPVSGKVIRASYYSPDWSGETISWDATRIYVNNMAVNGIGGRDGINFLVTGSEVSFKIVFTGSLTPQNIFIGAKLAHPSSTSFSLKGKTSTSNQLASSYYSHSGDLPLPPPPPPSPYAENSSLNSLYFPLIVWGDQLSTNISLANNGPYPADINLNLYYYDGTLLESSPETVSLGPGDTLEGSLADFFSNTEAGIYWVVAESNSEINGYETIILGDRTSGQSSTTSHQLPAMTSGANILYLPVVVSNESWQTVLSILNPNDEEASLVLTAYDMDGYLLAEYSPADPLPGKSISLKYAQEYFDGSLPPNTAWIKLESDSKIMGVEAIATKDNQSIYVLPAVANGSSNLNFHLSGQEKTDNNGEGMEVKTFEDAYLFLLNLDLEQGTSITINAYDSAANTVGPGPSIAIAPGALKINTLSDYFDGYLPPETTSIKLDSDGNLAGFVLYEGRIIFLTN
jgi:hypothetical protein